jgi:cell division protein FtsN
MSERDPQSIVLSRQSILLVTAVSVGLLTLCYVLGVQVGKQSAAIHQSSSRGSGEDLQGLPTPLQDQLKALETGDSAKPAPKPKPEAPKATEAAKPEPPKKPEAAKPVADESKWTLQLVSTPDSAEASRIAAKAKAAGYATTTVKDKDNFKVRLAKPSSKAEIDETEAKLKAKGFKTYPVKIS